MTAPLDDERKNRCAGATFCALVIYLKGARPGWPSGRPHSLDTFTDPDDNGRRLSARTG